MEIPDSKEVTTVGTTCGSGIARIAVPNGFQSKDTTTPLDGTSPSRLLAGSSSTVLCTPDSERDRTRLIDHKRSRYQNLVIPFLYLDSDNDDITAITSTPAERLKQTMTVTPRLSSVDRRKVSTKDIVTRIKDVLGSHFVQDNVLKFLNDQELFQASRVCRSWRGVLLTRKDLSSRINRYIKQRRSANLHSRENRGINPRTPQPVARYKMPLAVQNVAEVFRTPSDTPPAIFATPTAPSNTRRSVGSLRQDTSSTPASVVSALDSSDEIQSSPSLLVVSPDSARQRLRQVRRTIR